MGTSSRQWQQSLSLPRERAQLRRTPITREGESSLAFDKEMRRGSQRPKITAMTFTFSSARASKSGGGSVQPSSRARRATFFFVAAAAARAFLRDAILFASERKRERMGQFVVRRFRRIMRGRRSLCWSVMIHDCEMWEWVRMFWSVFWLMWVVFWLRGWARICVVVVGNKYALISAFWKMNTWCIFNKQANYVN